MRIAYLPLHGGKCPSWLFSKMRRLAGLISNLIVQERGTKEFLRMLSNPFWFQAFGCVLGFDWHSSGLTTTVVGALASADIEGVRILGGKGRRARISGLLEQEGKEDLARISILTAKMDSAFLQDGFSLYLHSLAFDEKGRWTVIQQGMRERWARRYHWSWEDEFFKTRSGIASSLVSERVLDLSSRKSEEARKAILDLLRDGLKGIPPLGKQRNLFNFDKRALKMPVSIDWGKLNMLKEMELRRFEDLAFAKGMGPKSVRALALIAKIVYGAESEWEDPVNYCYAHGGKDRVPYPVDRRTYEKSISYLRDVVEGLDVEKRERLRMLSRIDRFI